MEKLKININNIFVYAHNDNDKFIEIDKTEYNTRYGPDREIKNIIYNKFKFNFLTIDITQTYNLYYIWLNNTLFVGQYKDYQVYFFRTNTNKIRIHLTREWLWRLSDSTELMQQEGIAQPKPRKYRF